MKRGTWGSAAPIAANAPLLAPPPIRQLPARPMATVPGAPPPPPTFSEAEELEEAVWTHKWVRTQLNRILTLSFIISVVYWVFVVIVCALPGFMALVPPVTQPWPWYGALWQAGAGALFLIGSAAEASSTTAFLGLCALLSLGAVGLDVTALVALIELVLFFYAGTLTPDQQAASMPGGATGLIAAAGLVALMCMLDVMLLIAYMRALRNVMALRAQLERQRERAALG